MTQTVVLNESVPENVEVVAAGPQGPQGPQGPKGDVGDVNPQMNTILADAQSARNAAQTARDQAVSAQGAAETAKTGAESAQSAAITARIAAETAQTAAETARTGAETAQASAVAGAATATTKAAEAVTSASNAASSATSAAASASSASTNAATVAANVNAASDHAASALASKNAAATSAANAASSASTASTKATDASNSATAAATSATNAAASAATATTQAGLIGTAVSQASNSASQAATSASQAAISASNASSSVVTVQAAATDAQASKVAAQTAATDAQGYRDTAVSGASLATNKATEASTYATAASVSATSASNSAATATTKANEAGASATASANSATASGNSATASANSATASANSATQSANSATASATSATQSATSANSVGSAAATASSKASEAAASAAAIQATFGSAASLTQAAQSAQTAASLAQGYAASASSVVQQDLSGITAQALYRGTQTIHALHIYDTSKDSDGGAWTEKCQHTAWYNEPLMGKWLGAQTSEFNARYYATNVGPELILNGSADTTTGWSTTNATASVVDGNLRVSGLNSGYPSVWQAFSTVIGKAYRVVFTQRNKSVASWAVNKTDTNSMVGTNRVQFQGSNANTTIVGAFVATATTTYLHFGMDSAANFLGQYADYDDISVREIISYGASGDYYQFPTDGLFYRLWKNRWGNSTTFAWYKGGIQTVLQPNEVDPFGGTGTVYKAIPNNGSTFAQLISAANVNSGMPCNVSVYIKLTGDPLPAGARIGGSIGVGASAPNAGNVFLNSLAAGSNCVALANGWFRVWYTFVPNTNGTNADVQFQVASDAAFNGTSGFLMTAPQYESGSEPTTYEVKATPDSGISATVRGNKADFPRLAALIYAGERLVIYDLTEPGRPMWYAQQLAWDTTTRGSIAALNGHICVSKHAAQAFSGNAFLEFNFPRDQLWCSVNGYYTFNNLPVVTFDGLRLPAGTSLSSATNTPNKYRAIDTFELGSVAMYVFPDAPTDPSTGLRIPTIALGAGAGLYIIRPNGSIIRPFTATFVNRIAYDERGRITFTTNQSGRYVYIYHDIGFSTSSLYKINGPGEPTDIGFEFWNKYLAHSAMITRTLAYSYVPGSPHSNRVVRIAPHSTQLRSLIAFIGDIYNTGYNVGAIKRSLLSNAIVGSIGPSTELVVNGSFDVDANWSHDANITISGGSASFTNYSAYWTLGQIIPSLNPDKVYKIVVDVTVTAGTVTIALGASVGSDNFISTGVYTVITRPSSTTGQTLSFSFFSATGAINSVSVTEVDASYAHIPGAHANYVGTLSRAKVASGASLVGYSGFSANNYLREAYSTDLELGIGEWSASAWLNLEYNHPDTNHIASPEDATTWGGGAGTITSNTIAAPNGTMTADTFTGDGVNTGPQLVGSALFGYGSNEGLYQTVSIYLKSGTANRVSFSQNITGSFICFNTDDGTLVANNGAYTYVVTPEGNGWYRYAVTYRKHGLYEYFLIRVGQGYVPPATSGTMHVWGLKANSGLTAGAYTPGRTSPLFFNGTIIERSHSSGPKLSLYINTNLQLAATASDGVTTRTVNTTAAYNTAQWLKAEACYTTDGTLSIRVNGREVAASRGTPLLSLNSKYNLLLASEDFSSASWSKPQVTVVPNQTTAPDGTQTADLIYPTSSGTARTVYQTVSANRISFRVKAAGLSWVYIQDGGVSAAWFNVSTGAKGTTIAGWTSTIEPDAQGFYVCTVSKAGSFIFAEIGLCDADNTSTVTASGTNGVYLWGADARVTALAALPYQRVSSATDFAFAAPLTVGNSFALDAPFAGSIALVKLSATAPSYEQSQFIYSQEKEMFRANAQCVMPDNGAITDLAYDDATDRWAAISATNESYWSGLVRNSVTPVPAGSFTKIVANSGVELTARINANPGVDVTIPAYGLREELVKRAEAAARLSKELAILDYVGGFTANMTAGSTAIVATSTITYPASYIGARISGSGIPSGTTIVGVSGGTLYLSAAATASATGVAISFLDFELPVGMEAKTVITAGAVKLEGATKDYTRIYDGFIETIRFGVAPGATAAVQIQAQRTTLQ